MSSTKEKRSRKESIHQPKYFFFKMISRIRRLYKQNQTIDRLSLIYSWNRSVMEVLSWKNQWLIDNKNDFLFLLLFIQDYRYSHHDWACQKCDITHLCFFFTLNKLFWSRNMFYLLINIYFSSVNKIDVWIYDIFKQIVITCLHQILNIEKKKKKKNFFSSHENKQRLVGFFYYLIATYDRCWDNDIRCDSLMSDYR
jgi:hypothetical protein